ncbi:MAG TPA: hypothetical protein VFA45_06565 [Actinomycetes bacterium]|nr:hypothetical protein [Actinomycetes bacterium]
MTRDGEPGSSDRSLITELLARVTMYGVIDSGTARALSADLGIGDQAISDLIAEQALVQDGEYLYVSDEGEQRLSRELRARIAPEEQEPLGTFAGEFDTLDVQLKAAVTDWQHAQHDGDAEGQVAAVERWLEVDRRLHDAAARSYAAKRVFGRYLDRLQVARDAVLAGQADRLSGADESSYHSLWFLLHEVLLRTLGRNREE